MKPIIQLISAQSFPKIFLISALITAGYYFSFYNTGEVFHTQMGQLQEQLIQENANEAETKKWLKKQDEMKTDISVLIKNYEEVKAKIPTEFKPSELTTLIDKIGSEVGVTIVNQKPIQGEGSGGIRNLGQTKLVETIGVRYKIAGTFNKLLSLLTRLSQIEKIITIDSFSIERSQDGTQAKGLVLDAEFLGYKQVEAKDGKSGGK